MESFPQEGWGAGGAGPPLKRNDSLQIASAIFTCPSSLQLPSCPKSSPGTKKIRKEKQIATSCNRFNNKFRTHSLVRIDAFHMQKSTSFKLDTYCIIVPSNQRLPTHTATYIHACHKERFLDLRTTSAKIAP